MLASAKSSITLIWYSISDYFDNLLKQIEQKVNAVSMWNYSLMIMNYIEKLLLEIDHKDSKFFKVYKYAGNLEDKMSTLHAKTIIVDAEKDFISSANLSYHGLSSNIEIDTFYAKQPFLLSCTYFETKCRKLHLLLHLL